jgi:glycosyltransferase involved in cell wall biosynthesis
MSDSSPTSHQAPQLAAIIPALDEEGSIAAVIRNLLHGGVDMVIVGDNGSKDHTAKVARAAGAVVVSAPIKGYGRACLAAMAAMPDSIQTVLYCDADGSDDLRMIPAITGPVIRGTHDVVIGSRALGRSEAGALTPPQLMGNWVSTLLMRLLYRCKVTDLGPFRCVSRDALKRLKMSDPAYGWTAEMQVKAFRLGMNVAEVPVDAKCRTGGRSKVSGRFIPIFRAGCAIIRTVLHYSKADLHGATNSQPSALRRRSKPLVLRPKHVRQYLETDKLFARKLAIQ